MSPEDDVTLEEWQIAALVAFDTALASGRGGETDDPDGSSLHAVHECQRLLEALWPRAASPSERFGRFRVERELGRGGFGIVFLAEDTVLGRRVALKLPRPEVLATAEARRRFLREGEAAARLDHPHIVPTYEIGEEGPVCFLASAYCEGLTLADWLRERREPVPARLAAQLAAKLAGAVGHAHDRGILHRDLKPRNVLLQRHGGGAPATDREDDLVPRICDFGLAKIVAEDSRDTCTGLPLGSPAYMAPEQAAGRARLTGPAADVYALGAILYELLAGRPPLQGETVLDTLQQVAERDPPPLRQLRPGVSRDLDTICMKCLEKRPERRYANGSELAADLHCYLDGRPVQARPVSVGLRAGKWARRRPVHAALAAVVVLVVVGVVGGLAWSSARDRRFSTQLQVALDRAREGERQAQAQTRLAVERERLTRLHRAAAQTRLAQSLHEQGEVKVAAEILDDLRPRAGDDDLRSFAWHYLDRLCRRRFEIIVIAPFEPAVCSTALSDDGRTLAIGDCDGRVWLLDRATAGTRMLPGRHADKVRQVRFSPDGRVLASRSLRLVNRGEVKLWDVASGMPWETPDDHQGIVYGMVFSRDGRTLTTAETPAPPERTVVRAWTLDPVRRQAAHAASVNCDQLVQDLPKRYHPLGPAAGEVGSRVGTAAEQEGLAVAADGATVALDCGGGQFGDFGRESSVLSALGHLVDGEVVVAPITGFGPAVSAAVLAAIEADARALAGGMRVRLVCADVPIRQAVFSRDGRRLAFYTIDHGNFAGVLRVVDTRTGQVEHTYRRPELNAAIDWTFTEDGRSLIIAGADRNVLLWRFDDQPEPPAPRGHPAAVCGLAYSPDGRTLASAADDHMVKLWDSATGRELKTLAGHDQLVTAVAFAPPGKLLASASFDGTVRLWDTATWRERGVLRGNDESVRSLAFSPDGKTLASSTSYAVAFSPSGAILASAGDASMVWLWDVATMRPRSSLEPSRPGAGAGRHAPRAWLWDVRASRLFDVWELAPERSTAEEYCVESLAFSPDGGTLAASTNGGKVLLRDWAARNTKITLQGPPWAILGLAYGPDGRTLASAGRDKSVRLWEPNTGQQLLTFKAHADPVHAVAFSPDGRTLASGSDDGVIKIWRTGSGAAER